MRSSASTATEYLAELSGERLELVSRLRDAILSSLPAGFTESVNWGMLAYEVPLTIYPDTYNRQPLVYIALANQKDYVSLYLMGIYAIPELRSALEADFSRLGFKLRAGKSCIRFKTTAEVPWSILPKYVGALSMTGFIELTRELRR